MTNPYYGDCENCGQEDSIDSSTKFCPACLRAFNQGYGSHDFDMSKKLAAFQERERILKLLNDRMHESYNTAGVCNCYECVEIRTIIQLLTAIKETA